MLDFSEALAEAKKGYRISRVGWNGNGQWVALRTPDALSKINLPYLYISTVKGEGVYEYLNPKEVFEGKYEPVEEKANG